MMVTVMMTMTTMMMMVMMMVLTTPLKDTILDFITNPVHHRSPTASPRVLGSRHTQNTKMMCMSEVNL